MAAYHIASLPSGSLSSLLSKKFWDSSYFNIWIMYVGITRGEQTEFRYFLSGNRFKLSISRIWYVKRVIVSMQLFKVDALVLYHKYAPLRLCNCSNQLS